MHYFHSLTVRFQTKLIHFLYHLEMYAVASYFIADMVNYLCLPQYYRQCAERGRGRLTLNDLERVSTAHDFTWSPQELLDMIYLFNRSHTGVVSSLTHNCGYSSKFQVII